MSASPALPDAWQQALAAMPIEEFRGEGNYALPELSHVTAWAGALDSGESGRFGRVALLPINQESRTIGVIIAFIGGARYLHASERDILLSASNLAALAAERRALYNRLNFRAQYDELTGLENRACLFDKLLRQIGLASRDGRKLAVLYIDLDGFKTINDSFGHGAGDAVLREVSARMLTCVRHSDTVARLGGDEFAIVLPSLMRVEDAERVAAHLERNIAQPIAYQGHDMLVNASVGLGIYPVDGEDCESLMRAADGAMYREKSRRQACLSGPLRRL